jgi:hypothetical protein
MSPSPGQSKQRYVVTAYNSRSLTLSLSLTALAVLIKVFLALFFLLLCSFVQDTQDEDGHGLQDMSLSVVVARKAVCRWW